MGESVTRPPISAAEQTTLAAIVELAEFGHRDTAALKQQLQGNSDEIYFPLIDLQSRGLVTIEPSQRYGEPLPVHVTREGYETLDRMSAARMPTPKPISNPHHSLRNGHDFERGR